MPDSVIIILDCVTCKFCVRINMDLLVLSLVILSFSCGISLSQYDNPHFFEGRNTIVHLFEWKWDDIANECERFLQHKGYAGVQVSPPNENLIIKTPNRPWWERYQPVSYQLITRSGTEDSFKAMVKRCNAVGVRIYVDAVINHMSAGDGLGTGGNNASATTTTYPAVPYGPDDFHSTCTINNFNDLVETRNCRLVGLTDLNQGKEHVREKIVEFLNHLIDLGIAGFRVDAAGHMWPDDLKVIYSRLKNLNEEHGFPKGVRPFIYQEVPNMNRDYLPLADLLEFTYGKKLSKAFRGDDKLKWLKNWGTEWGLIDGLHAVAFIDNHDNQRSEAGSILTYKQAKRYKMAIAFMLAHPYGTTRVMSSFNFDSFDQGPPADKDNNIESPRVNPKDNTCTNGWVCEHRWRQIYNMVEFRNVVAGSDVRNWWSNDDNQISFCRGNKGFIVFTNWGDINRDLQTCLPAGRYCDVISGYVESENCTGKLVDVKSDGTAHINLRALEFDGMLAIHVKSKVA